MNAAEERAARLAELPFETIGSSGGHVAGFFHSVGELWGQRELMNLLVRRELKAKYKDSVLGFFWTLARPIIMLLIYYFAVGQVLQAQRSIPEYAIYVFSGLTIWGFFNEIVSTGTMSILSNAGLIKKVYLPREIFPLAATGSALVNFAAQFGVLLIATVILWQFPLQWAFFYVIPATAIIVIWSTGVSILLSALNVYMRDIQYLVEVALLVLFWVSPIVYSYGQVHSALFSHFSNSSASLIDGVYLSNPVTLAVLAFQKALWIAGPSAAHPALYPAGLNLDLLYSGLAGLLFFWIAQRVFSRLQGNFAQEI